MEITATLDAATLTRALAHVSRTVARATTIPILTMVRVEMEPGAIVMTANNLDMELRLRVPADTAGEGAICVAARGLQDIASRIDAAAAVTLSWADDPSRMGIRAGRGRYVLPTAHAADFPDLAPGEAQARFGLPAARLAEMLAAVSYAMSAEESRYYLCGAYMHAARRDDADMLRLVAVDGHKLSMIDTPAPNGCIDMPGMIIPSRTVGEITRLCRAFDGEARIAASETHVAVEIGDVRLTSKLIDGTYPDYERKIPRDNRRRATIDAAEMSAAVGRAGAVLAAGHSGVRFAFESDRLVLSAQDGRGAEAREEIEVDYGADPIEIGLNATFVVDTLAALGGDRVTMSMADAGTAVVLERGHASPERLALIMPMRV